MNPLLDVHHQANAQTQPYGEIEIVTTFGEVPAEYAAIRKGCAILDLPQRGIIELTGRDRLGFLNNLISNQTYDKQSKTGLSAGKGVYAFLLNARSGRIICDMNVIERGERSLLELDRRLASTVADSLEKYRFAEQVQIVNRSDELHEIALIGPSSALAPLAPLESTELELFGVAATCWRDDPAGSAGYQLIIPVAEARKIWMNFIARGENPPRPIGWAAFNAARIEAGRPIFGIDFDESVLPHETGPLLERAVSFTKGCYPGQEIVARMQARGGTARKIVGIRMSDDALPIAGSKIYDDAGNEIGGVTSSTISPVLSNAAIALGIVKRPHFNVGSELTIPAEGEMRKALVVELPFVREKT
jgi:folate-binding protein YgfZ